MRKTFRIIALFSCFHFFGLQAKAQSNSYFQLGNLGTDRGAEYTSGKQPGTILMKVNLWGAINRPGIHHIPVNSDLLSLISYGGGPATGALLDEVTIKREFGNSHKIIKVDVEELVKGSSHHNVVLSPNDVIVIPQDEPFFDRDTLTFISVISLTLTSILTAIYIRDRN